MSEIETRRRRVLFGGVASLVLVAGSAVVAVRSFDGASADSSDGDDGESDDGAGTTTAQVTKRNLEEREELAGTLGYGDPEEVSLNAQGTITALPALGTLVDRGQMIVEVDGRAIPLWFGDRPLWRPLDAQADDGVDIQQVEANLVALGFASASTLTVDQDWTSATTTAVKKWQKSLGREETGVVSPGDVVLLPEAVRIAELPTPVGSPASGPVAKVTGAGRQVTIDLDATKQSLVTKDQAVEVVLPDGTAVPGKIASVGTVATAGETDPVTGQAADPSIEVVVTLDDPSQAGSLDQAPVTVRVVTSAAQDVLAVPVDALLALAEGGYAVERVASGGAADLVPVETGAFADGWVEITGELAEGDEVVVPA